MSVSVIAVNVYRGTGHVVDLLMNMAAQTCRDFELILADAWYAENKDTVSEMSSRLSLPDVIHVPACLTTHCGRRFAWEGYNTALLLSRNPVFVRTGVFRLYHHDVVKEVMDQASRGTWVSFVQRSADNVDFTLGRDELAARYELEMTSFNWHHTMNSHCGMFSYSRDRMIEMNGNNECILLHHFEDVDLNCRWHHSGSVRLKFLKNALLRIDHNKDLGKYAGKPVCDGPPCIAHASNDHELDRYAPDNTEWFEKHGFRWARCPRCGAVSVENCAKWFDHLVKTPAALVAPIGVGGVGRDIRKLDEDLKKLTSLQSKLELLQSSHTDSRYLA